MQFSPKRNPAPLPPPNCATEYGVVHRLWVIAKPELVAAIQLAMADSKTGYRGRPFTATRLRLHLSKREAQPSGTHRPRRALRIRDDDFHQYAQRRADDLADATV